MKPNLSPKRFLLEFALKYKFLVILTVILSFSSALFNGVSTALIVPILIGFLGQKVTLQGGPPFLQKTLQAFDVFPGDMKLAAMMGAVLLAIILKNAANYGSTITSAYFSRSLVNSMRLDGLKLLLDIDIDFHEKNSLGDIMNRINTEISRSASSIQTSISLLTTVATILVFLWILLSLSWQLTLISTLLLFLIAIANQYYVRRAKRFGKNLSETSKNLSNALIEILTGIRLVKTVGTESVEYSRIEKLIREREKADLQSQANFSAISPISEVGGIIAILIIIICGRIFFSQQLESLSTILLTYLVVLFRLLPFVNQLNGQRSKLANFGPSVEIVIDFLRRDQKPFMKKGNISLTKLNQGIQLEKVSFAYPGHDDYVLKEIDLWIPRGKTTALVGSSGAGKSTIADLVPRFYDPIEGRILFDGKDLRDYDLPSLRTQMGIVSQDTFLFNRSVGDNIAYGYFHASEADIIQAAKRANAYEFIMELPQGFDTQIGDRGVMLSGGQRQRIAIARALLRNPEILILDEATSALDTVSERVVQEAIDELCRDRTTIVIAHRLSTIQNADQIAVLDQGRLVELGTHEELLAKGGYYANLYQMQFSKEIAQKTLSGFDNISTADALKQANTLRTRLSYETRNRLNTMLGSLQLVADGIIDNYEERQELIEETYNAGLQLLYSLEDWEKDASPKPSSQSSTVT
ncbi:MAG: ABC transporter ATP-binding protein [Chroococcales cyanobacterium]